MTEVNAKAKPTRAELRAKILNQQISSNIVVLEDGFEVEVRQTSVGNMLDSVKEEDLRKRMFSLLLLCCVAPGTDESIFDATDYEAVMTMPSSGYYQKLIEAVNKQTSLEVKVEEAKKS